METTPEEIDALVTDFCKSVNSAAVPVFVPVKTVEGGKRLDCYANVAKQVKSAGGKVEHGWIIWLDRGFLIEAEHHAIWVSPEGDRIDISPHTEDRVLFLPGAQPFEGKRIFNVRRGLSDDPRMTQYLDALWRIDQLTAKNEMPGGRVEVTTEMQMLWAQAAMLLSAMGRAPTEAQMMAEMPELRFETQPRHAAERGTGHVGRNDPCPCGSGRKFKKCCLKHL